MEVRAALEYVARNPEASTDVPLNTPVWELVARALFEIANTPDARVRGSVRRATRAQRIIFDRMVGLRKAGSMPVDDHASYIEFVDLAAGGLE